VKKSVRDKGFTLMIIPHSAKSSRTVFIPPWALKMCLVVITTLLVASTAVSIYFVQSYKNIKEHNIQMTDMTRDYEIIKSQLDYYQNKTRDLEQRVNSIEDLDKDIREILKDEPEFKDKTSARTEPQREVFVLASRGGVNRQDVRAQLQDLEERIEKREESLIELKEALEKREKRLACTPSIYPVNGRITSRFGNRRSPFGRRIEFHDGLDIAAPYGTTIKATADGTVSFVGYRAGYGYCVDIVHGYGYKTSYCHNSKNLVKVGQRVKKGEAIAKVGNSGRSTGPHVHYMVYVNGVLKNPLDFCN